MRTFGHQLSRVWGDHTNDLNHQATYPACLDQAEIANHTFDARKNLIVPLKKNLLVML